MLAYVELVQRKEKEIGCDVLTHQKWQVPLLLVQTTHLTRLQEWGQLYRSHSPKRVVRLIEYFFYWKRFDRTLLLNYQLSGLQTEGPNRQRKQDYGKIQWQESKTKTTRISKNELQKLGIMDTSDDLFRGKDIQEKS